MQSEQRKIDGRTLWLPIGAVMTIIASSLGFMVWMTSTLSTLQLHTAQIVEIKTTVNNLSTERSNVIERISSLEAKIDLLLGKYAK